MCPFNIERAVYGQTGSLGKANNRSRSNFESLPYWHYQRCRYINRVVETICVNVVDVRLQSAKGISKGPVFWPKPTLTIVLPVLEDFNGPADFAIA